MVLSAANLVSRLRSIALQSCCDILIGVTIRDLPRINSLYTDFRFLELLLIPANLFFYFDVIKRFPKFLGATNDISVDKSLDFALVLRRVVRIF